MRWSVRPPAFPAQRAIASCTRFSPNTFWPAASTGSIASQGWVLETATRVTSFGSRPAACAARAIRATTSA